MEVKERDTYGFTARVGAAGLISGAEGIGAASRAFRNAEWSEPFGLGHTASFCSEFVTSVVLDMSKIEKKERGNYIPSGLRHWQRMSRFGTTTHAAPAAEIFRWYGASKEALFETLSCPWR